MRIVSPSIGCVGSLTQSSVGMLDSSPPPPPSDASSPDDVSSSSSRWRQALLPSRASAPAMAMAPLDRRPLNIRSLLVLRSRGSWPHPTSCSPCAGPHPAYCLLLAALRGWPGGHVHGGGCGVATPEAGEQAPHATHHALREDEDDGDEGSPEDGRREHLFPLDEVFRVAAEGDQEERAHGRPEDCGRAPDDDRHQELDRSLEVQDRVGG